MVDPDAPVFLGRHVAGEETLSEALRASLKLVDPTVESSLRAEIVSLRAERDYAEKNLVDTQRQLAIAQRARESADNQLQASTEAHGNTAAQVLQGQQREMMKDVQVSALMGEIDRLRSMVEQVSAREIPGIDHSTLAAEVAKRLPVPVPTVLPPASRIAAIPDFVLSFTRDINGRIKSPVTATPK